jgi:hypothetical protein
MGSLTTPLPFRAGCAARPGRGSALADHALRAAELTRDLGVAALLEVTSLDRQASLGRQRSEELECRRVGRRLEKLDRFVVEVDRLRRECTPRLVLDATATCRS